MTAEAPFRIDSPAIQHVYDFVQKNLPGFNRNNYAHEQFGGADLGDPPDLETVMAAGNLFARTVTAAVPHPDQITVEAAMEARLPLGMILSSAERYRPGVGSDQMRPVVDSLEHLGHHHGLPPVLTTAEYYLHNPRRLTFTDHTDETLFIDVSEQTARHFDQIAQLLMPLSLDTHDREHYAAQLEKAATLFDAIRGQYLRYHTKGFDGNFFQGQLRGYSMPITIDGITYPAKSIATLEAARTVDTLLGLTDLSHRYNSDTRTRLNIAMAGQDTERLMSALDKVADGKTIVRELAAALHIPYSIVVEDTGFDQERVSAAVDYAIQNLAELNLIADQLNLEPIIRAIVHLMEASARAAATHQSLIYNYMIKPREQARTLRKPITDEMGREEDTGLGGLPVDEVVRLRALRSTDNPLYHILKYIGSRV